MKPIEIFRPGKFKAMSGQEIEFSATMLESIAKAYEPSVHQSPLVIGHPKLEDPAYGWVKALSFANSRLVAEPEAVVEEFAGVVAAGLYKNVSASFFTPDHPANPKPGNYYLKHVGFLGATPPAVSGLKPVSFASGGEKEVCFEFAVEMPQPVAKSDQENEKKKENELKEKEFADKEKDLNEREKNLKVREAGQKKAEFASFLGDLKKKGRLIPAVETGLVEFMMGLDSGNVLEFAGEKKTQVDFFKSFLEKQPKVVCFSEVAPDSVASPDAATPTQLAEKAGKLKTRLEGEGVVISYADAVARVSGGEE